jgi:hypothetical protein
MSSPAAPAAHKVGACYFGALRGNQRAQAFLDGAGPAAIGAILGSAMLLARALTQPWQYAVLTRAAVLLLGLRRGVVLAEHEGEGRRERDKGVEQPAADAGGGTRTCCSARKSALNHGPVSTAYLTSLRGLPATLERLRIGCQLTEAMATEFEPLHLAEVFGISADTAIRYAINVGN